MQWAPVRPLGKFQAPPGNSRFASPPPTIEQKEHNTTALESLYSLPNLCCNAVRVHIATGEDVPPSNHICVSACCAPSVEPHTKPFPATRLFPHPDSPTPKQWQVLGLLHGKHSCHCSLGERSIFQEDFERSTLVYQAICLLHPGTFSYFHSFLLLESSALQRMDRVPETNSHSIFELVALRTWIGEG